MVNLKNFKRVFILVSGIFVASGLWAKETDFLSKGYDAFSSGDWAGASMFLSRVVNSEKNSSEEVLYMLITSLVYSENYKDAVTFSDAFLSEYPESPLSSYVRYQKGKSLYFLDQYDEAVVCLSDFCHENIDNPMYGTALFWLAECFYRDYDFETAKALYQQLLEDYPGNEKSVEAGYRLSLIEQSLREQKLQYLLKVTGEEYLSARESYEKQIREYQKKIRNQEQAPAVSGSEAAGSPAGE